MSADLTEKETKLLRGLDSQEIHDGKEKLTSMMVDDILHAKMGTRTRAEEVEAIEQLLNDPAFQLKMETLVSLAKVEKQQDLLKFSFSDAHRREFKEAYEKSGRTVPDELATSDD